MYRLFFFRSDTIFSRQSWNEFDTQSSFLSLGKTIKSKWAYPSMNVPSTNLQAASTCPLHAVDRLLHSAALSHQHRAPRQLWDLNRTQLCVVKWRRQKQWGQKDTLHFHFKHWSHSLWTLWNDNSYYVFSGSPLPQSWPAGARLPTQSAQVYRSMGYGKSACEVEENLFYRENNK